MSKLGTTTLAAFQDELHKLAWTPPALLGSVGALGGVGAGAGALLGGGIQSVRNYRQAREMGASRGQAMFAGLGGGMQGASKGALIGGALGAAGGGALGHFSPEKAESIRKSLSGLDNTVGSFARFGQRQAHGLTGWTPQGGLAEIRHGAANRLPMVDFAKKNLERAQSGLDDRGYVQKATDKLLGRDSVQSAQKALDNAQAGYAAAQKAEEMGLTNLPGYLRALRKDPRAALSTAFKDQWHSGGGGSKALLVGLPALELAKQLRMEEDPSRPGEGKGQRVGRALAMTAAGTLLSPLPGFTAGLVRNSAAKAGDRFGKAYDHLRARPQGVVMSSLPRDLTSDSGQAVPSERMISERAAGTLGEGSPS